MSDWGEEDNEPKPKLTPATNKRVVSQDDDWDEGPSNQYEKHGRDRSTHRGSEGKRSNNNYMSSSDVQEDQLTFTVSKSSVGMIIGRGGSKIKELEQNFNVKLNIGK